MALCIGSGGGVVCSSSIKPSHHLLRRQRLLPLNNYSSSFRKKTAFIVSARKVSSRTGKFDSKNKRSGGGLITTKEEEKEEIQWGPGSNVDAVSDVDVDDGYFLPELPGDKPDFWEGPQWNALGFFVQYMWAFGIVFALIACGIAVATYNEGATDFKKTPAFKESIQSQELLEEPDESTSDVFEANPTEEAPSLE